MRHVHWKRVLGMLCFLLAPSYLLAQPSTVDPDNKFAWAENAGWINWSPAGIPPADAVQIELDYLQGFVWSENLGWINLGRGPANGVAYTNTGTDHGVNIDSDRTLSGFAWAENAGWINFETSSAGADEARIDWDFLRFRGFAWAENFGWINLDDSENFVGFKLGCLPDQNFDGQVTPADFSAWIIGFNGSFPRADMNGDGLITPADFNGWILQFNMGC